MAFGYTLLLTENPSNEQERLWYGYDTSTGGMLLHMRIEHKLPDGGPDVKAVDEEIFLPGDQVANMGSISWTTLQDADVGRGARRIVRAYQTPGGNVLVHRYTKVDFTWVRTTRTIYVDEHIEIVPYATLSGTDIIANSSALGGSEIWNYLDLTKPSGLSANYEYLYQFDRTNNPLNDKSGNARHLTVQNGTARYTELRGQTGFQFDADTRLLAPLVAALQTVGAFTFEMVLIPNEYNIAAGPFVMECGNDPGGPETLQSNVLYAIQTRVAYWDSFHEAGTGAGTNHVASFNNGGIVFNHRQHIIYARAANGYTYYLWIDGQPVGPVNASPAAPPQKDVSGNLQRVRFGGPSIAGQRFSGTLFSTRFCLELYTDAMALESYKRVRGIVG